MKFSIVIPVFNERNYLPIFAENLRKAPISSAITEVEIIVVDDASTDGSHEISQQLFADFALDANVRCTTHVLKNDENQGKGFSVRKGIEHSTGDILIIQDADQEYSMQDYPQMLEPIIANQADVVFGSRFTGSSRRVLFFWHSLMNWFLTTLSNALTTLNLTDMETGYKAFRGELIRSLRLNSRRFGFEPEVTARVARANVRVFETNISYFGRTYDEGKKIGYKDGIAALFHIFRFNLIDREPFKPGLHQTLNALDDVAKQIYLPSLKSVIEKSSLHADTRILEIGAGIGSLTGELAKHGTVTAIEIYKPFFDKMAQRFTNNRAVKPVFGDATKLTGKPEKYDLVVCYNVLEHIEDDQSAVGLWADQLKDGGRLAIYVPFSQKLFTPIDAHAGHVRRYERDQLVGVLQTSGLRVTNISYHNPLGIIGWILNGKIFKRADLSPGQLKLYSLLKPILRPLENVLSRFVGLSLMVVAERERKEAPLQRAG